MRYEYKLVTCVVDNKQKEDIQKTLSVHGAEGFRVVQVIQGPLDNWILMENATERLEKRS